MMKQLLFILLTTIIAYNSKAQKEQVTISHSDMARSIELYDEGVRALGDFKDQKAIELMSKAIILNDGNTDFYLGRAQAYSLMNKLDEAITDIEKAIELSPEETDLHYTAGNIYFKKGDFDLSLEHYTLSLSYFDDQHSIKFKSNCLFNRGNSLMKMERYAEAEHDFTSSIAIDPVFSNAFHNRGVVRKNLDKSDEACKDFTKANELGSNLSSKYLVSYCD